MSTRTHPRARQLRATAEELEHLAQELREAATCGEPTIPEAIAQIADNYDLIHEHATPYQMAALLVLQVRDACCTAYALTSRAADHPQAAAIADHLHQRLTELHVLAAKIQLPETLNRPRV